MSNPVQQTGGPPPSVTAGGSLPPGLISSYNSALTKTLLSGTAEPPTFMLIQPSSALVTGIPAGATDPPPGFSNPSDSTGLPAGFSIPSGVTGPPPGITPPPGVIDGFPIPTDMTNPPPRLSIPSGVAGFPAGMTGVPSDIQQLVRNHAFTPQQAQILIGVTSMLLVLCVIAVGGRLVARRVSHVRLESDDWSSVAALAILTALCIEQYVAADYGLRILKTFPPKANVLHTFGQAEFASEMTYAFVTSATKISVLMLYRRIFSLRLNWFRIAWWTNMGLVAAMFVTLIILNCTQCTPLSNVWNTPWSCLPSQTKTSSLGFINAFLDSAILALPLRIVWSLQLSRQKKVAICGVFGLGLIAVAVSIARAVTLASPRLFLSEDHGLNLWSTTEPAVALICSCLPVMRPLYTVGLKRIGSSRGWTWYSSKRSKATEHSAGSSSRDEENSNMTGTMVRSPITTNTKQHIFWSKTVESELSGPYQEVHSPDLPVDKPLPPAYLPRQEEDTGYHTWSWNLLSRPRNEGKAPKLTRSPTVRDSAAPWRSPASPGTGVRTTISGGKWSDEVTPIRLQAQSPTAKNSPNPRSQFENSNSPAKSNTPQPQSPLPNPNAENSASSPPPPSTPMRHIFKCDARHKSIPESSEDILILQSNN